MNGNVIEMINRMILKRYGSLSFIASVGKLLCFLIPWIPTKLSLGEGSPSVDYEISDKKKSNRFILHFGDI